MLVDNLTQLNLKKIRVNAESKMPDSVILFINKLV